MSVDLASAGRAAAFLLGIGLLLAVVMTVRERRLHNEDEQRCVADCEVIRSSFEPIIRENESLGELAYLNFRQMRIFTTVAIRQARASFYACIGAAWATLTVLVVGIVLVLGTGKGNGQLATAGLTAVGSSLSTFLAASFIKSYAMAARQMSYYYGQPLVHCYLLHAEWLTLCTPGIEPQERQRLLEDVVAAAITASQNAQRHLLQLQGSGATGGRAGSERSAESPAAATALISSGVGSGASGSPPHLP